MDKNEGGKRKGLKEVSEMDKKESKCSSNLGLGKKEKRTEEWYT